MRSRSIDSQTERAEQIDHVASHLLARAALLVRLLVKQVRNSEISRTEGEVLGILRGGARRVTELAELEGVAQPTMTLLVKRLEGRGWVEREGLAEDGRVALIRITDAGRPSATAPPDRNDRQLEEDVHRPAEDRRADGVPARRHDGGEDRDPEDDHAAR